MTLKQYLSEVKQRAEKATSGPWIHGIKVGNDGPHLVCSTAFGRGIGYSNEVATIYVSPDAKTGNPEFIAHSRTDIPRLIAIVEAQAEALEKIAIDDEINIRLGSVEAENTYYIETSRKALAKAEAIAGGKGDE